MISITRCIVENRTKYVDLEFDLPEDVYEKPCALAKRRGITFHELVVAAITAGLTKDLPIYNTTRGPDGAMTVSAEPAEYMPRPDHLPKV